MNQQKYISTNIFVFYRWSRKHYAIFASLGRLIKIGVLKADICQKALLKGLIDLDKIAKITADFDEDETTLDTSVHDSLQFILSALGLTVFQTFKLTTVKLSKKGNPLRTKLINEYKVCFLPRVINRLFFSIHLKFHKSLNINIQ